MTGRLAHTPPPVGLASTREMNEVTALTASDGSSTARPPMSYSAYWASTLTAVAIAVPRPEPVLPSTRNSSGHMPPVVASPAPPMPVQQVPAAQLPGRVPTGPQASGGTIALVWLTAYSASFLESSPGHESAGLETTPMTRAEMPCSALMAPAREAGPPKL